MMSEEQQIEEIKDHIDSVYGCDCAYFGVDGLAIAAELYRVGYRRQREGEWVLEHKPYGKMICSNCKEEAPKKTVVDRDCTWHIIYCKNPFCPKCGARMGGGVE